MSIPNTSAAVEKGTFCLASVSYTHLDVYKRQGLNREKLENEYQELEKKIAYYNELLADPEKIKGVLRDELLEIRDK